jgi:hypothetical protein
VILFPEQVKPSQNEQCPLRVPGWTVLGGHMPAVLILSELLGMFRVMQSASLPTDAAPTAGDLFHHAATSGHQPVRITVTP